MTTLHSKDSIIRPPGRCSYRLLLPLLGSFALSPIVQAQDGGYCFSNTAEGDGALNCIVGCCSSGGCTGGGSFNTAIGVTTLFRNCDGNKNTATGFDALSNNNADANTATGYSALVENTTGTDDTATGADALLNNIGGNENTANGSAALLNNTNGNNNTATGVSALRNNTTASKNTAEGFNALYNNNADANTAIGYSALLENTTGTDDTAAGADALLNNAGGNANTANGSAALLNNTNGNNNTATGVSALRNNTAGSKNTAEGYQALLNNSGSNNIGLGSSAGSNLTSGSNNIDIGAPGVAGEAAKIRIGTQGTQTATFIAGIYNVPVTGSPVVINSNGKLGIGSTSSARFKRAIKPMERASEAILELKPVTFRYKNEIDPEGTPQFGLVAEQVEKVDPDLITRDEEGKAYAVRYDAVNAMLLNEFLKAHQRLEEQASVIAKQQKQIDALTVGLRKVSAEVETKIPATQVVTTNQ